MTSAPDERHVPVMRDRVVGLLAPAARTDGVVVDATVGLAGHAAALLAAVPGVHLVALDRDPAALELSRARLAPYADRVRLVHATYDALPQVLAEIGVASVDGVLFDLGVSSLQLDETDRGFAYAQDAALDMRMDPTTGPTAADVLNTYSHGELARILREYGEERFAGKIASAIVRARADAPFTDSARLSDLVRDAIPAPARRTGGHPAKRTFQALRIEVNGELAILERALPAALDAIHVGGRVVVLAYHSLEDRLVKQAFRAGTRGCICPPDLPVCGCGREPELRLLTRGAERPSTHEVAANPRAASARLRAVERVRPAA